MATTVPADVTNGADDTRDYSGTEYARSYAPNYTTHPYAHPKYRPHVSQADLVKLTAEERRALAERPVVFKLAKTAQVTGQGIEQGVYRTETIYRKGERIEEPRYRRSISGGWMEKRPQVASHKALEAASLVPIGFREEVIP